MRKRRERQRPYSPQFKLWDIHERREQTDRQIDRQTQTETDRDRQTERETETQGNPPSKSQFLSSAMRVSGFRFLSSSTTLPSLPRSLQPLASRHVTRPSASANALQRDPLPGAASSSSATLDEQHMFRSLTRTGNSQLQGLVDVSYGEYGSVGVGPVHYDLGRNDDHAGL
jgi:hypothetical protein